MCPYVAVTFCLWDTYVPLSLNGQIPFFYEMITGFVVCCHILLFCHVSAHIMFCFLFLLKVKLVVGQKRLTSLPTRRRPQLFLATSLERKQRDKKCKITNDKQLAKAQEFHVENAASELQRLIIIIITAFV